MKDLKSLQFEVKRTDAGDPFVWIKAEPKNQESQGLNYISFILIGDGISDLFERKNRSVFSDGLNVLQAFGELWTFISTENYNNDAQGTFTARYMRLTVARDLLTLIHHEINKALVEYDQGAPNQWGELPQITLDYTDNLPHWGSNYGQGTGTIRVDCDDETQAKLDTCKADPTFSRCWETVCNLAYNQTHKSSDVGIIRLALGFKQFFWSVPGSMHGGIVDHGTDKPDWSVHT